MNFCARIAMYKFVWFQDILFDLKIFSLNQINLLLGLGGKIF